jgi:hypothetical protein
MRSRTFSDIALHLRALADLIESELGTGGSAELAQLGPALPASASTVLLDACLETRGLVCHGTRPPTAGDLALVPLAQHIASTWPRCEALLQAVKRAQGTARVIRLHLDGATQEEVAALTTLGNLAARAQLLPRYRYARSPVRELVARPPRTPEAIAFFTGRWLELVAFDTVARAATAKGWEVHAGVLVGMGDGDRLEIDCLACAPDGRLLFLEAKSGDRFGDDLPKLRRLADALRLPPTAALLLAPGLDERSLVAAASQAGMSPAALSALGALVTAVVQES